MTDFTFADDRQPFDLSPGMLNAILMFIVGVILYMALQKAERDYERGALRAALIRRRRWRSADRRRLADYPLGPVARRRAARASGPGRPVVRTYKSFSDVCADAVGDLAVVSDPTTPLHEWRRAIKRLPCWPETLEALCRGERDAARAAGRPAPHDYAVHRLAEVFGLSPSSVRQICTRARKEATLFDAPGTLADFGRAPVAEV